MTATFRRPCRPGRLCQPVHGRGHHPGTGLSPDFLRRLEIPNSQRARPRLVARPVAGQTVSSRLPSPDHLRSSPRPAGRGPGPDTRAAGLHIPALHPGPAVNRDFPSGRERDQPGQSAPLGVRPSRDRRPKPSPHGRGRQPIRVPSGDRSIPHIPGGVVRSTGITRTPCRRSVEHGEPVAIRHRTRRRPSADTARTVPTASAAPSTARCRRARSRAVSSGSGRRRVA